MYLMTNVATVCNPIVNLVTFLDLFVHNIFVSAASKQIKQSHPSF